MSGPDPEKWNAYWRKNHLGRQRENPTSTIDQFGIADGSVVADLGCGDGYFTIPLIPYVGKRGIIYAIDSNFNALSSLRNSLEAIGPDSHPVKILEANISMTPLISHSIDTVILANIFHDIEDRSKFLEEIRRILKPTGMLIDIDWHRTFSPYGPPQNIRIDKESAKRQVEEKGFSIIKSIEAGSYHYGLIFGMVADPEDAKNREFKE